LQELDPILWVSVPNTSEYEEGAWMNTACFHVEKEGMRILVPVSQESESFETDPVREVSSRADRYSFGSVNPMLPFSFIYSFLETLASYLGEVTEHTIRENFDTVYMVSLESG
jgi:hypothetical protein